MQPELLAYLAGVMDSDGYFTIATKAGKVRRDLTRATLYNPRLGCGQVDRLIPDLLCETFGGSVRKSRSRQSVAFIWQACSVVGCAAAEALLPYVRLKRRRAEIVVELGRVIRLKRERGEPSRLTPEDDRIRAALTAEIRSLNRSRNRKAVLA